MGALSEAAVKTVVDKLDEVSDAVIVAIDETQNAAFDTAGQVLAVGEDLGDLAIANLKEGKERLEGLVRTYADLIAKLLPV